MGKIKLILAASILLLSGQVGASFLYGIGSGPDQIKSIGIDTGASTRLFSSPLYQTSGLAIPPNPVPAPPSPTRYGVCVSMQNAADRGFGC